LATCTVRRRGHQNRVGAVRQRGLVRKTTDSVDGRSVRVSLTAEARRLKVRIIGQIGELMAPMTGPAHRR
jgi:DNA-binding MarR family transcriptional regulator